MRRLTLRATGLLAIALAAITCTDATTAPGSRGFAPARLGMAPSFSPAASRAYTVLAEAGVTVTQVHIVLRTAEGVIAKDTVIVFPAGQDTLTVELPMQIQGTEQSFSAQLDLLDATGVVLFSHTQQVTARASSLPAAPPPTIVLEYVGPGHAARTVAVSPTDLTLSPNVPLPLVATAIDSSGRAITDLIVSWTSSDTSIAKVVSTGRAAATVTGTGRRGSVTVSATTPTSIVGTARFSLLPLPTALAVISGNAQTGVAGHPLALPLVLELQGLDGGPIPNAAVVVTAVTAGGVVGTVPADTLLTTDAAGRASVTLTPGRTAGAYAFQARAGTLLAPAITATATAAPAAALAILSGNGQSAAAGAALPQPFAVTVTNEFGAPVIGATVSWTRTAGTGTLAAATSVTDATGVARVAYTLGTTVATDSIRAALPGLTTPASSALFTATTVAGAAAKLVWLQEPADTIVVGATFAPVSARIADAFGNAVRTAGVKVLVRGTGPAGAAADSGYADSTLTDTAGIARVTLGTYQGATGQLRLALTSAGLDSLVKQITAASGPAAALHVLGGVPATAQSGVPFAQPVVVQVTDVGGNPVAAAVTVTASTGGGATLSGTTSATTAADGRATLAGLTMSGVAGSYTLRFDAPGLSGTITPPIALSGGVAATLAIAAGDAQTGTVGGTLAARPVVRVTDANGNPVRGGRVIFSARNGGSVAPDTVSVDATGTASTQWTLGTAAGIDSLVARLDSSTVAAVTFTATATAGAPARFDLSVSTLSPVAGQPVSVQAQLLDANGNAVRIAGHSVTWTASVTGGAFSAPASPTDSNGVAQVSYTTPTASGTSVVLTATEGAVTGSSAAVVTVTGTGSMLGFEGSWLVSGTTASGAAFAPQPVVQLLDANGNAVRAAGILVTATVSNGPTAPAPTLAGATATTDAAGRAVFTALAITGGAGDYTLAFSAPAYSPLASSTLSIGAGAVSHLAFGTQPPAATTAGAPFVFAVSALDASGNVVTSFAGPVSVEITSGTGHAGAALHDSTGASVTPITRAAVNGVATFERVAVDSAGGGYTLTARTAGLDTTAVSNVMDVAVGAPTQLALVGPMPSAATSGAALAPQPGVQLRDAAGNAVALAGVTITATIASGTGGLTNETAITNASGVATFTGLTITGPVGSVTLSFGSSGYTGVLSAPIGISAGAPGQLVLQTLPPATSPSGVAFAQAPVVQLQDASGNPVSAAGVSVTASITSGGGSLLGTTTVSTSALGQATFSGLGLSGPAGAYTLSFDASGLTPATAGVTVTAGAPAAIEILAGNGQAGGAGANAPVAPRVVVKDVAGNVVPGASVVFTAITAGDSLFNGTVYVRTLTIPTDASGEAAVAAWKLGTTGFDTLTATVGTYGVTFAATSGVGAATHFVIISGAGQSATVTDSLQQLVVMEARDANEQPVPNVAMVVNYDGDNGYVHLTGVDYNCDCYRPDSVLTDAQGRASFSWFMSYRAKLDSVYVENDVIPAVLVSATALMGPATTLRFDAPNLADDVGNTLRPFKVWFTDAGGFDTVTTMTGVPVALTYSYQSCASESCGDVNGTSTMTVTAVNGVATFDNVSFNQPGTFQFLATAANPSGGDFTANSDYFTISNVGPHFVVVTPYETNVPHDSTVTIQLRSQSAHGDPLPNLPVMVSTSFGNGAVQLAGGAYGGTRDSATTDANGLITLTWTMPSNTGYSLQATVTNYEVQVPLTLYANSVAGPVTQLLISGGTTTATAGSVLPYLMVRPADAQGNPSGAPASPVSVSLTGGDPTATLSGTTTHDLSYGYAYFTDLVVDKPGTGYRLHFTSGTLVADSDPFDVAVAPASIAPSGSGRTLVVRYGAGTVPFVVKDAEGKPLANATVNVGVSDYTSCYLGSSSLVTDAEGNAVATMNATSTLGGCIVTATTSNGLTATARFASIATNTTHVWMGAPGTGESAWNTSGAWEAVAPMTPGSIPSSPTSDDALVASWTGYTSPRLTGNIDLRRIQLGAYAVMNVAGSTLKVWGDSSAGPTVSGGYGGEFQGTGKIMVYATDALVESVSMGGGTLAVGDTPNGVNNDCNANKVTARLVYVNVARLEVRCPTWLADGVQAQGASSYADASQPSVIHVVPVDQYYGQPSFATAGLDGDTLIITGLRTLNVGGAAVIGSHLVMEESSSLMNDGGPSLTLNGTRRLFGATVHAAGGTLVLNGSGTMSGGLLYGANGTVMNGADTLNATRINSNELRTPITLTGTGSFTNTAMFATDVAVGGDKSEGYTFSAGDLRVSRSLVQQAGLVTSTFVADNGHTTHFDGDEDQALTFGSGENASRLGNLEVAGKGNVNVSGSVTAAPSISLQLAGDGMFNVLGNTLFDMSAGESSIMLLNRTEGSTLLTVNAEGLLRHPLGGCFNSSGASHLGAGLGFVQVMVSTVLTNIAPDEYVRSYCQIPG